MSLTVTDAAATTRSLFEEAEEYIVVKSRRDTDDYVPDEPAISFPFFFGLLIVLGAILACVAFYISYRQEWCSGVHSKKPSSKVVDDEEEAYAMEEGVKIPKKTFQDSKCFDRMSPSTLDDMSDHSGNTVDLDDSNKTQDTVRTVSSSKTTARTSQLCHSVTIPRCVLCSVNFTVGEAVTHSTNPACHHEYHEKCLTKHWSKNADCNGKCPVCKETYVVQELAPSRHFSSHLSALGDADEDVEGPFSSTSSE